MKRVVVTGGRVFDPAAGIDGLFDIVIMGGRVASITPTEKDSDLYEGFEVIDAEGLLVVPGLIDLHTHLREPGFEYKETIKSGAAAAAAGGFTSILCMANTEPVNDCASVTRYIKKKADDEACVNVYPVGAVSAGLRGETLSEIADLVEAGCVAISDDGVTVKDPSLMRRALEYSKIFDIAVISHAEDPSLSGDGVMNEGAVSTRLGLKGIPNASEDTIVARDVFLAKLTGARLHIAHVSTHGAVELIRAAKSVGVKVTAECTPHHLILDDSAVLSMDTSTKMSPPLRGGEDVEALRAALADGTIDAVATDHAPHSSVEKDIEFDAAANGIIGLETALPLTLELVDSGAVTLERAVEALTTSPAKISGLDKLGKGSLKVGSSADITIIDMEREWVVDPTRLRSISRNTPFGGRSMKGAAVKTIVAGEVVYSLEGKD